MASTIANAIAFAKVSKERTRGHKGVASTMALMVSMLGFALSFVLTFFLAYIRIGT